MSTKLRDEFIRHMTLQCLVPNTQRTNINAVNGLAIFYNKSPALITDEEVQEYFLYLLNERRLAWSTIRNYLYGITYFFRHVCQREVEGNSGLPTARFNKRKLPFAFSIEEVERLLSSIDNLKHRVLLKTIYSAGLRVGVAVKLRPQDIESDPSRMLIRVEQGKGHKDRYTILSKTLLSELREYWLQYRPGQLPKCHDHQNDTAPIHPSAHKQNRGWQAAAPALWVAAAETLPDKVFIGESVEKTTGLTLIVSVV